MIQDLFIAAAGADARRVRESGRPCLSLCCGIGQNGRLSWRELPPSMKGDCLGICSLNYQDWPVDAEGIAADVLFEVERRGCAGVLADFETPSSGILAMVKALDTSLSAHNIPFFIPPALGMETQNAYVVIDTALSGGSLSELIEENQKKFGENRIAAQLLQVSNDFTLPSLNTDGVPISKEERENLLNGYHASVFYSRELCAKYFTYMDEKGQGHFVLFDDNTTLEKKLSMLENLGIQYKFMLYPDAEALFSLNA